MPRFPAAVALLLAGVGTGTTRGDDWPNWRGQPAAESFGEDSGFDRGTWPPGKPEWTETLGLSGSAPIVADGRL